MGINSESKMDLVIGRNSVIEALKSKRNIDFIYVAKGNHTGSIKVAIAKAKALGVTIKKVDVCRLNSICGNQNHQGIAAYVGAKEYVTVEDILETASKKNEQPFIIIADGIEDPHNLGAIIRTAECAGVHGIVIPKRRCVGVNYTVSKTSAGAVEHMNIARVTNLCDTIDMLKKNGIWVYGLDMDGQTWCETDLKGPIALVVGAEGKGISRIVKEGCDAILSLPMVGEINSLNASVAAGLGMYEILRQRMGLKAK